MVNEACRWGGRIASSAAVGAVAAGRVMAGVAGRMIRMIVIVSATVGSAVARRVITRAAVTLVEKLGDKT